MQIQSAKLLAQFNIAQLRHGPDDPRLVGFASGANMIRKAASSTPGHIWNQQDIVDNSFFATRSVWESLESLQLFVYSGIHRRYLNRKAEWFVQDGRPNTVLWWVDRDEIPELYDAQTRLQLLREHGPSKQAFNFHSALEYLR